MRCIRRKNGLQQRLATRRYQCETFFKASPIAAKPFSFAHCRASLPDESFIVVLTQLRVVRLPPQDARELLHESMRSRHARLEHLRLDGEQESP